MLELLAALGAALTLLTCGDNCSPQTIQNAIDGIERVVEGLEDELDEARGGTGGRTTIPPPPLPPPDLDPAPDVGPKTSVESLLESHIDLSDSVIDASTIDGEPFLWIPTVQRTPSTLSLADIRKRDFDPLEYEALRRGVSTAVHQDDSASEFGGWMDHSFFFVATWNPVRGDPLHPTESTFTDVYSIGDASGSNPVSGSATWTGVMAGIDENEDASTFGNLLRGDATVRIPSFTSPAVNVSLTNIRDNATGGTHNNISWSSVPLSSGGFRASGLRGQFYGPGHEEVGGIFLRNEISGAFGASRQ